eukprot:11719576-Alexandrium_andersonii.AAC.1
MIYLDIDPGAEARPTMGHKKGRKPNARHQATAELAVARASSWAHGAEDLAPRLPAYLERVAEDP